MEIYLDIIPKALALSLMKFMSLELLFSKAYSAHHHHVCDGFCYLNLKTGKIEGSSFEFAGVPFVELYRIDKRNPCQFSEVCSKCFGRFQILEEKYFSEGLTDEEEDEHIELTDIVSEQGLCDHRTMKDLCEKQRPVDLEAIELRILSFY